MFVLFKITNLFETFVQFRPTAKGYDLTLMFETEEGQYAFNFPYACPPAMTSELVLDGEPNRLQDKPEPQIEQAIE